MIWRVLTLMALGLAACAPTTQSPSLGPPTASSAYGPIKRFTAPSPEPAARSNADMAQDFLDLHFQLESGKKLDVMTRFERPLTLRITGQSTQVFERDMSSLLIRLQREAKINITRVDADRSDAAITIAMVPTKSIQKVLPTAACFVVPNVSSLQELSQNRRSRAVNWSQITRRDRVGIFIPVDTSPQEQRDCLHEELAQALGPLNDLYRLPDSVFNDDNVHAVLTGFDMLVLRVTYAPELQNGMTREQVAARLPSVFSRYNPRGNGITNRPLAKTPTNWKRDIETALGPGKRLDQRLSAAQSALRTARAKGWSDHRRAFSEYTYGLLIQRQDAAAAQNHYRAANAALSQSPNSGPLRSLITTQTAAFALASGDPQRTVDQTRSQIPVAKRAENAIILSTLMMLQSTALNVEGQSTKSRSVRVDSYGWARYGFGADEAVKTRSDNIAALGGRPQS